MHEKIAARKHCVRQENMPLLVPMNSSGDGELVTRYLQKRDERALEMLVCRYMAQIYNYARRYTGNADIAADITQETFVKAWKNLKRFDCSREFRPWLFAIAQRTAIDWLRKKNPVLLECPDAIADASPSVLERLIGCQQSENLALALAQLPEKARAIIELHAQDELTFREIGERLAMPLNTIKSQYRRAVILLRRFLHQNA